MRPVARQRCLALLALGFLVFAQLGGLAHQATARHVVCALHGELIDSEDGAGDSAGAVAPGSLPSIEDSGRAAARGHEHCAIESFLRQQHGAASPTPVAVAGVAATTPVALAPSPRGAPARAVYRFAPKTSPPASLPING